MTSAGIALLVLAAVGTLLVILGVQYALTRKHWREAEKRLLEAERAAAEKQRRLDELLLATERNTLGVSPSPASVEPRALPSVPEDLLAALRAGDCTLFAGSGVSAQSGFPVWQQTLSWDPIRLKLSTGELDVVADVISSRVQRSELLEVLSNILWLKFSGGSVDDYAICRAS